MARALVIQDTVVSLVVRSARPASIDHSGREMSHSLLEASARIYEAAPPQYDRAAIDIGADRTNTVRLVGRFWPVWQNSNNIHIWRRETLSSSFAGIDEDVERLFLDLSCDVLEKVLADYRKAYGAKKHAYARKTYTKWKSGEVHLSGEVCERLLAIVPRHLDFGTKYDLVVKLWRRHDANRLQVTIIGKAADEALRLQVKGAENKIDLDILNEKLDQAARVARDAATAENVQIDFATEHKSKQGDTRISVRSIPGNTPVRNHPGSTPEKPNAVQGSIQDFGWLVWLIAGGILAIIALAIAVRH